MWSLCGRVASDDKQIFEKRWRDMICDNEWVWHKFQMRKGKRINLRMQKGRNWGDGEWKKGEKLDGFNPKRINWRWFVRVFCWRFLEISSRICIFTLIWVNLGGISVFVILSFELLWVAITCAVCRR